MKVDPYSRFAIYECANCSFEGFRHSCEEAQRLEERIWPGEPYTDRECPDCGALAFPKED